MYPTTNISGNNVRKCLLENEFILMKMMKYDITLLLGDIITDYPYTLSIN